MKSHSSYDNLLLLSIFTLFFTLLFIINISFSVDSSTQSAAIAGADSGLVAHYTFDDGSVPGKVGTGAMGFDGDDTVSVSHSSSIDSPAMTISFWTKLVDTTNVYRIFDKTHASYIIRTNGNGRMELVTGAGCGTFHASNSNKLIANEWQLWTITMDSSGCKWYVDGIPDTTIETPFTGGNSSSPLIIGGNLDLYKGSLDDVRIYSRSLSSSEIGELYELGGGTSLPSESTDTSAPYTVTDQPANTIPTSSPGNTTYYVDTNSSQASDSNTGTEAVPWKTVQKAADFMTAGDTVIVKSGTYTERVTITKSGTSGSPITFKGSSANVPKGFSIDADSIVVRDFEIAGSDSQYAIFVNGSNIKILNNYIHDSTTKTGTEIMFTWYQTTPVGNIIKGNKFSSSVPYGGDHPVISLFGQNHIVEDNEIGPMMDADVFRPFGSGHIIRNNYIHDLTLSPGSSAHADIIQGYGTGVYFSNNILFESNFIKDSNVQMGNLSQDGDDNAKDWTFKNNVFVNVGGQMNIGIPSVKFLNNTFYNVNYVNESIGLIFYNPVDNTSGNGTAFNGINGVVKNNIFVGGTHQNNSLYHWSGTKPAGFVGDYNYIVGPPPSWAKKTNWTDTVEVHGKNGGDPMFVNEASPLGPDGVPFTTDDGFRLRAGSPGIDAGENGIDIGAYEYYSGQPSTPIEQTPPPVLPIETPPEEETPPTPEVQEPQQTQPPVQTPPPVVETPQTPSNPIANFFQPRRTTTSNPYIKQPTQGNPLPEEVTSLPLGDDSPFVFSERKSFWQIFKELFINFFATFKSRLTNIL